MSRVKLRVPCQESKPVFFLVGYLPYPYTLTSLGMDDWQVLGVTRTPLAQPSAITPKEPAVGEVIVRLRVRLRSHELQLGPLLGIKVRTDEGHSCRGSNPLTPHQHCVLAAGCGLHAWTQPGTLCHRQPASAWGRPPRLHAAPHRCGTGEGRWHAVQSRLLPCSGSCPPASPFFQM